jgi:CDP-glucose 4,6-dehydratase
MSFRDYYRGKRVLVTGHTGFKGSWLCRMLQGMGAEVYGYSEEPPTDPCLYDIAGLSGVVSEIGDIRDMDRLSSFFSDADPEAVIHMAAQPLVGRGYSDPRYTYEVNVMGTVNILECVRSSGHVSSFLNVTTDKVYDNKEKDIGYVETDPLDGFDPDSNSKSCSEILTHSYSKSFFQEGCAISTARAGNVIGGGDFADRRIIPDCVRAALSDGIVHLRNPGSVRPFQHVLEPLTAYLTIVEAQSRDRSLEGWYNVGPDDADCVNARTLAELFCDSWGEGMSCEVSAPGGPHEAGLLKLDSTLIRTRLGWSPRWDIAQAVDRTVEWTREWAFGEDVPGCMDRQIRDFMER